MNYVSWTRALLLASVLAGTLHAEKERACWLSDLDLSKVEQNWGFAVLKDKNYTGKPLSIGGKIYERGFQTVFAGEGAQGTFELELKPGVQRFLASVGMNDEPDFSDPIEFFVYADDKLLWSSGKIQSREAAKAVDVPLTGKKRLLLLVKNADNKGGGNGDWADARIVLDGNTTGDLVSVATAESAEIFTPKTGPCPKINGAKVFGVRPGNPFFFKIPATGLAPITFGAKGLPNGLNIDPKIGIITGSLSKTGEYQVTVTAQNAKGKTTRPFKIVVGEKLALTPPMGWASYNCWGLDITEQRLKATAEAFVKSDLINHGWTYVNIDDGWQARVEAGLAGQARKAPSFTLEPNDRFTDMKGLCDYVHSLGLKIGIYSTPWKISYGGYTGGSGNDEKGTIDRAEGQAVGKVTFEVQDARQWAAWGFDSMKYDWRPNDVPNTRRMSEALRTCGRDILFTLSNSADINQADKWAELSHFWRTTGDIFDRWWSMSAIGFSQDPWKKFAGPGHWNDPDMLVVGHVGWGRPRPTSLTPNEQYTHISLWCLLSAPLLLGCDLSQADEFTLNLLTNDEVIEVDQDPLGCAAGRVSSNDVFEVWAKDMEDGSKAVGLFNTTLFPAKVTAKWSDLGLTGPRNVRDLWRQKDLGVMDGTFSATIPRHGVVLVRIAGSKSS